MKSILRITVGFLILWYILIPSIRLLCFSEEIKHVHIEETQSYKEQIGEVLEVKTILSEKYPVNYDKDVFKRIYQYKIKNLNANANDTLLETVKKNTYFFKQLKPAYKEGDTISYYKSHIAEPKLMTVMDYNFMIDNNEGSPIKWFSIVLLILGLLFIYKIIKPILK